MFDVRRFLKRGGRPGRRADKRGQNATAPVVVACVALLFLSGCGAGGNTAKVIGSWKLDAGLATITVTYSSDHTYIATMAGLANGSETGQWRLDGDRLIETPKSSTIDASDIGKENVRAVVKLDDSVLIVRSRNKKGEEETMTLQRVR